MSASLGSSGVLGPRLTDVLAAVHDRLFPAGRGQPGAVEIGSIGYVARALEDDPGDLAERYRMFLVTLDSVARKRHGQGFSRMDPRQQDALLREMQAGRLAAELPPESQRSVFVVVLEHLREGLFADPRHGGNCDGAGWRLLDHPGYRPLNEESQSFATQPEPWRPPVEVGPPTAGSETEQLAMGAYLDALARAPEEVDVVVVGLGATGSLATSVLAGAGLSVVALEAGPWRLDQDFRPDELEQSFYGRAALGQKFTSERPTYRRSPEEPSEPLSFSLGRMVNGVGGSLAQYAAWLRRFHEWHFRPRSHLVDLYGRDALPDGSTLVDWPITYADLEPYYCAVEHLVGVSGDDANPFVRRSRPLPMPPLREFPLGQRFTDVTRRRAWHPHPVPVGINSVAYGGRPATDYSAWSNGFGILARDRWHPQFDLIPAAVAGGNATVRTHCRALAIVTDRDGRARAVRYVNPEGHIVEQRARAVVLAAYTFETVRLMLLSADSRHPQGLGNQTGQLGQHFMPKMFLNSFGRFPGARFNRHTGPAAQAVAIDDLLSDGFDTSSLGFVGGGTMSVAQQALPLQLSRDPRPADVPAWGDRYREHLLGWQELGGIWMQPDALPYQGNSLDLDPWRTDSSPLGLPVLRVTYSLRDNERRLGGWMQGEAEELLREMGATQTWRGPEFTGAGSSHDLGGCRAGDDPSSSVVGPGLEVHDTPGLFVFSGAAFPSCPGTNPTLTIMAWALRAAEGLATSLGGDIT